MIRLPFSGSGYVPPPHPNPIHIGNGVYVRPERHGHIQDGYPHQSPAAQEAEMTSPKALDDATLAEWREKAERIVTSGITNGPSSRVLALLAENATLRADRAEALRQRDGWETNWRTIFEMCDRSTDGVIALEAENAALRTALIDAQSDVDDALARVSYLTSCLDVSRPEGMPWRDSPTPSPTER